MAKVHQNTKITFRLWRSIGKFFRFLFGNHSVKSAQRNQRNQRSVDVITPVVAPQRPEQATLFQIAQNGQLSRQAVDYVVVAQPPVRTFTSIFNSHFEMVGTIGDGNCFFRAVAYQSSELGASADGHHEARMRACQIMEVNRDDYTGFIQPLAEHKFSRITPVGCIRTRDGLDIGDGPQNRNHYFAAYVVKMGQLGTYATELQIRALSIALDCPIVVFAQRSNGEVLPTIHGEDLPGEPIFVHYNGVNHYSALNITASDPRVILGQIQGLQREQAAARERAQLRR